MTENGPSIQELKEKFQETRDESVAKRNAVVRKVRDEPKTADQVTALTEVTNELINIQENHSDEKDLSSKKRKVVRKLKHFTVAKTKDADGISGPRKHKTPRKSKGWSPKANKFFSDMVMEIKQDVATGRLGRWEELYRGFANKREKAAAEETQDGSDDEDDHQVNCADIYELELVEV